MGQIAGFPMVQPRLHFSIGMKTNQGAQGVAIGCRADQLKLEKMNLLLLRQIADQHLRSVGIFACDNV